MNAVFTGENATRNVQLTYLEFEMQEIRYGCVT